MAELGELLRAWRDRALMTQEQLAEITGMSERTIRRLESGAMRQPRSSSLRLLADALGLDAGERAAITEALRAGGPSVPAPRRPVASPAQLPLDVYGFAGRQAELMLLDQGLASGAVVAITGTAGVGKTALAVHWAHRQAARFGDGQLYVNLRGAAAQLPMRPVDVLAQFLRALGVANDQIPAGEAEAAGLYRSVLAGRRVLIVLDNAEAAEHVRPLVPGSAGCLVLVTSRHNLEGLVASHSALSVRLSVLTPAESSTLVTSVLGQARARAEAGTVAQLADLCGHLPLALRIAAARLAYEPAQSIAQYVDLLRVGDRLSALQVEGDPAMAVRATFDLSYRALPGPAATMFRLLGLVPGHDITVDAAAALAGTDPGQALRALRHLGDHNLVGELGPGRYSLHDLLRVYASERTTEADNDALHRLLEHYLRLADRAARLVYPHMVRLPQPEQAEQAEQAEQPMAAFPTYESAQSWFVTEQANLVAAIIQGAEAKLGRVVWLLADVMRGHLLAQRDTAQWLACASSALAAATAASDPGGIAAAQLSLGAAHYQRGEHESALVSFEASLVNSHQASWDDGELAAAMNTGLVHRAMGRLDRAIDSYQHVAELAGQGRRWLSHAAALSRLGSMFRERGQLASATRYITDAIAVREDHGLQSKQVLAEDLNRLGIVLHDLGRLDDALTHLARALAEVTGSGDRGLESLIHDSLAGLHRDLGRLDDAWTHARLAARLARETHMAYAEAASQYTVGTIHQATDRHEEAIEAFTSAVSLATAAKVDYVHAQALTGLAVSKAHLGAGAEARHHAIAAVAQARRGDYRVLEGNALTALALVELRAGQLDAATAAAEEALAVHNETGHRQGASRTNEILDAIP